MSNIMHANFMGDPNIGLFGFATDKYFLAGHGIREAESIGKALGVRTIKSRIMGTLLCGMFSAGNSSCIITSSLLEEEEVENLGKIANVLVLETEYSAIGNLVLMNDNGCLVSSLIKRHAQKISKFTGLKCEISKSSIHVIGSAALATNRGCILHPNFGEHDAKQIGKVLGVPAGQGTVNFGSPFVGAGIIANSNGFAVSEQSTGIEVARMEEVLFGYEKNGD